MRAGVPVPGSAPFPRVRRSPHPGLYVDRRSGSPDAATDPDAVPRPVRSPEDGIIKPRVRLPNPGTGARARGSGGNGPEPAIGSAPGDAGPRSPGSSEPSPGALLARPPDSEPSPAPRSSWDRRGRAAREALEGTKHRK